MSSQQGLTGFVFNMIITYSMIRGKQCVAYSSSGLVYTRLLTPHKHVTCVDPTANGHWEIYPGQSVRFTERPKQDIYSFELCCVF